jgi:hypothetical protein
MEKLPKPSVHTDAHTETRAPLLAKREAFAVAFVELQSATRAYRAVYDCAGMAPLTVRRKAYDLRHSADVAARVRELYDEAAADTMLSARARMARLQAIVEADPGELVRVVAEPCRYCHGVDGKYQWRDADEFTLAVARAFDDRKPLPSDAGGYGFTVHSEPNPTCEECRGDGVARVVVTPTDQLSPAARALLKGVRQKASGEVTVLLHDQLAASDQLNKMAGMYVDKSLNINANVNARPVMELPADATPEQIRQRYLAMIGANGF